jgi:uncharacterized protein (TIGR03086 family)
MTAESTTTALTGGVALLERAMAYTLGSLALVTPEAMSNPTPCVEWDLRALLHHMNDSLLALQEAIAVGRVGLDPAGDCADWAGDCPDWAGDCGDPARDCGDPAGDCGDPAGDPVATLRNRACRMIGAWANARGPGEISIADRRLTSGIVAATGAVEVAVHGWDVARACGEVRDIPPALAEELLELCTLLVDDTDRPERFAARVDLPRPAGPSDRLVAFLGRRSC